ncbi:MAG TPA: ABC transporter permease [Iamia sp.]|jgi:peptide/nickel transport system permease protein|nr:ABC transporter permease [Iamia sp.]
MAHVLRAAAAPDAPLELPPDVPPEVEAAVGDDRPVPRREKVTGFVRDLLRSPLGTIGLLILLLMAFLALFGGWVSPHDPTAQQLSDRLQPPLLWGGSGDHILGTDQLGRDLLSRIIDGTRVSMIVAFSVVLIAGTFGIVAGLCAGYFGKMVDAVIMRVADLQLAFPGILLALVILYALGASTTLLIVVLSMNGWMVYARMTRSLVLSVRKSEYIEAAEIAGASHARVMFGHILPNLVPSLLTLGVLEFARIILAEASLSFLGYGIQPPDSSWGLTIAQGQDYLTSAWWLVVIPGLVICITVLSANLFASWLRVHTDPRLREKQMARQLDRILRERP